MMGRCLMKCQHEPAIGLGEFKDGILVPIKVKSQDTTFGLDFQPTQKDIKAMITRHRKKRLARTAGQTLEVPSEEPQSIRIFPDPC